MARKSNEKSKKTTVGKIEEAEKAHYLQEPTIVKRYLKNGQYLSSIHPKRGIFLHHTAGTTAEGAMSWWDQTPERVGTPYVIDRDGTIYECFNPSMWAYHLGIKGDDNRLEKETVNIELVSAGWLKGGWFFPLYPSKTAGRKIPEKDIVKVKFRGESEFHRYTDQQIDSLCRLIYKLKKDFPTIELPNKLPNLQRFDQSIIDEAKGGLWSHANVRKDKTDLFPQKDLKQALNRTLKYITQNLN